MNDVKMTIEEEIARLLKWVSEMEPGTPEYGAVIKQIETLSNIVLEDDRNTINFDKQEFEAKNQTAERIFKESQQKLEFEAQQKRLDEERIDRQKKESRETMLNEGNKWVDRGFTLAVKAIDVAVIGVQLAFWGKRFHEGLRFEQTGNLTSKVFSELRSKMMKLR